MTKTTQKQFFETLFNDCKGFIEIRTIIKGKIKQDWYETSEIDKMLYELKKPYYLRTNVYFGVCPRREEKGKEENVCQVNCLWVDLDAKNIKEKEAIKKKLDSFSPKPSIVVSSGNGYHCYWLLDRPEEITSQEDIDRLKGHNKGLAEESKGDKGIDLSRVLRVPDTKNLKDPENILIVRIVKFEPQIRYSLEYLTRFKRDIEQSEIKELEFDQKALDIIPDRFWKILEENTKIRNTWKGERKNLKDNTRSGYDMSLAMQLMPYSFKDSELLAILKESPAGKGKEASLPYLKLTIGKAKGEYEKRKREAEAIKPVNVPVAGREAKAQENMIERYKAIPLTEFLEQTPDKIPYLIGKGLLPKQGYLMIAGKAKEGKTKLALMITLCLALGLPIFVREDDLTGTFPTPEKIKSLYLYREAEGLIGITLESQIKGLEKLFKIKISQKERDQVCLKYPPKELCLDVKSGQTVFENIIKANPVDLVIIDPVLRFFTKDMNKMPPVVEATNFIERIGRKYNCSFILIHHLKKEPTEDPFDAITGSATWRNCYSSCLILQRRYEGRADMFKKVTFEFRNAETPDFITVKRESDTSLFIEVTEEEALRGASSVDKLVKLIENNFKEPVAYTKITDLAREKWGVTKNRTAKLLRDAVERDLLDKVGVARDTRYSIKTQKELALL